MVRLASRSPLWAFYKPGPRYGQINLQWVHTDLLCDLGQDTARLELKELTLSSWLCECISECDCKCVHRNVLREARPIFPSNFLFSEIGRKFRPIFHPRKIWTNISVHFLRFVLKMVNSVTKKLDGHVRPFFRMCCPIYENEKLDGKIGRASRSTFRWTHLQPNSEIHTHSQLLNMNRLSSSLAISGPRPHKRPTWTYWRFHLAISGSWLA